MIYDTDVMTPMSYEIAADRVKTFWKAQAVEQSAESLRWRLPNRVKEC
jgi:hypothetical protein